MNSSASFTWVLAALLLSSMALAQLPAPPGTDLAAFAARRFPQPVRVGDLIRRPVLQPLESRPVLGHVVEVVRVGVMDKIIVEYGGFMGFGARPIAVPIEALALLGNELEILDFTPEQLNRFPTYDGTGALRVGPDEIIRMGLAHPSH